MSEFQISGESDSQTCRISEFSGCLIYTGDMMSAQDLARVANELRAESLRMVSAAGAGHVAGPMSSADVVAVLYFGGVMRHEPKNPWWEERDRFVLSCGHYCPILYVALSQAGYFEKELLGKYMQIGGLPGHPEYRSHPGIEATTGSLGQGVSQAVGMAMALKIKEQNGNIKKKDAPRVYCMLSDGELQEGQVWEAFNTAVRRQLDNLVFIVDRNHIQIENYISQVATYGQLSGRLESFGLHVLETDGHKTGEILKRLEQAKEVQGGPAMVIAHTTAGKGVSFMEGRYEWHDKVPSNKQLKEALAGLKDNTDE